MTALFRPTAAAALLALAPPAFAQGSPQTGGTLTVALNSDIRSLEPGINRDSNTDRVIHSFMEGLVGYTTDLSVGPQLAESWVLSEDGKTYTFTLRPEARFHNSEPVTSAEVKWSWERQFNNDAWPCRRFFDGSGGLHVIAVETPDPRTVTYQLEAPSAVFLKQLANIQCGIVVSHPNSANPDGTWNKPIGTGPFKLGEWRTNEYVALERFADYQPSAAPADGFSGARIAYVDSVRFRIVPDKSAAQAALSTGEIDIVPDIEPIQAPDLENRGMVLQTSPGLAWSVFLLQTKDPLLSNPKMRQAIAHAIDLNQLAAARTGERAQANPSAVSEASAYFDTAFQAWAAYDPARARELASEAGYDGQPLKIQTNKRFESMFQNAVIIQAMLAVAGIQAELETLDWAAQLDNYLKGNFQMQAFGFSARLDPGLMYQAFVGSKDGGAYNQWDDPQAFDLLTQSMSERDEAKRAELFNRLHALQAEQVPMIGLHYPPTIDAIRPDLRGYKAWAANAPITWGVWKAR